MRSTVGEKGQVTIPKRLRDGLGIAAGSMLEFTEEHGTLVARKVLEADPITAMIGILPQEDVDAALRELRGPDWSEDLDGKPARAHRRR
jgi:antitoxin PrlF